MNGHRRFQQLAVVAFDFTPSIEERQELDAHLRACVECRRFVAGLRADANLVRTRPAEHTPARVRQAVVAAASGSDASPSAGRLMPLVAAVIIALTLVARFVLFAEPRVAGPLLPTLNWSPLGDVSTFGDGLVMEVTGADGRLIAVGGVPHPETNGLSNLSWGPAAIWVSEDGLFWWQVDREPTFEHAGALDVAVHDGTVAVLGMEPAGLTSTLGILEFDSHGPVSAFRVWLAQAPQLSAACATSSCGWQTISLATSYGADRAWFFTDLAAGGPGFVLVGGLFPTDTIIWSELPTPVGAVVGTSTDGVTWAFNDPTAPEFAGGSMQALAAGPSGLVAVGDTGVTPTIWYSADGVEWARVEGAVASPSASIRAVAASPDGWVAVGDDQGDGRSWVSTDGRSWQTSPTPPGLVDGHMLNVTWLGSEFIATGVSADGTTATWHSLDGLTWSPLDITSVLSGIQVQAAGAIGSRELLFGFDSSPHVAVAVGQPSDQP